MLATTNPPTKPPTEEEEYLAQLPEYEKKALDIARKHLKTSFCLKKSNGFVEWKKTRSGGK